MADPTLNEILPQNMFSSQCELEQKQCGRKYLITRNISQSVCFHVLYLTITLVTLLLSSSNQAENMFSSVKENERSSLHQVIKVTSFEI